MTTDEVYAADADLDLAILRLDGHAPGLAALGNSANVLPGDPIVVIGNPLGIEGTISSGLISGIRPFGGENLPCKSPLQSHLAAAADLSLIATAK